MRERTRLLIQSIATVLMNANLPGFFTGRIWQGSSKQFCLPGLNCYSCPGALGACPIGALQASLSGRHPSLPGYVLGTLILFGVLAGRLICALLCPFGLVQDLLYKLPGKKLTVPPRLDRPLRYVKYVNLLALVILMPLLLHPGPGFNDPWFCKLICPAGTLGGSLPLLLADPSLRALTGAAFMRKAVILVVLLALSVFTFRPFCKYLCPLGAFYALFNRVSLYRMSVDEHKCTGCRVCERTCKMGVRVREQPNAAECIRCGACRAACPTGALSAGVKPFLSYKRGTERNL